MQALQNKRINLIKQLKEDPRRTTESKKKAAYILPVVFIVLIVAVFEGYLLFIQKGLKEENISLNDYLNNPDNITQYNNAKEKAVELEGLRSEKAYLTELFNNIQSYPDFDLQLFEDVYSRANLEQVKIEGLIYNRDIGELDINCSTSIAESPALYAEALRNYEAFSDVIYLGYSGYSGVDNKFSFSVTCIMKGEEAEANE